MTMPSQIMVRPQGVLAGNGVVEGNVINTGGRLEARADSPDADPGTLTIVGSLNISSPTAVVSVVLGGTLPRFAAFADCRRRPCHPQRPPGSRRPRPASSSIPARPSKSYATRGAAGSSRPSSSPGARVSASYGPNSLILRVVCPADWDTSGLVNSADFFEFLAAFFRNDADFNNDNITDSQDLFDYLGAFFGPCVD